MSMSIMDLLQSKGNKRNEVWKYLELHGKEVNKMEPQVFSVLSSYYFHPGCECFLSVKF